ILDVLFLSGRVTVVEHSRLAEVIAEALAAIADLCPVDAFGMRNEAALAHHRLERAAVAKGVGIMSGLSDVDRLAVDAVALVVMNRGDGPVDRDLVEIGTAEPRKLGVEIGEQPSLEKRVVSEIDARNDVARVESGLFGLGKEVVG